MRRTLVLAAATLALVGAPLRAPAVLSPVVVATYFQYIPGQTGGPVEVLEGQGLLFAHEDWFATQIFTPWHDITSVDKHPTGVPYFETAIIGFGDVAPVEGVEDLAPGTYAFYCGSHGADLMSGTLIVQPRPA